ncbi:pilus assembly protein HicB [Sphingomonas sp. AR_OL41]|uniref:pilus assembly protein HicB n=1 Tax=Sphingomonas sp. AR_OL41 TaxID=3042729 RepID=UPI00248168A1|nr:pilus assembly protein HicB [Sphingomonas sp. AR_OL41]MDH7971471.1 pilus assembly protein HicB [Sphingomonas sp. AR_OL41]
MSSYPLRLPEHVMAEARQLAEQDGTSLNQFLSSLIAERVGELRATADIQARAARANPAAKVILARVPDRTPLAGDELPGAH